MGNSALGMLGILPNPTHTGRYIDRLRYSDTAFVVVQMLVCAYVLFLVSTTFLLTSLITTQKGVIMPISYHLRDVDEELWKRVKKLCIDRSITIRTLIINLLRKEVGKEKS